MKIYPVKWGFMEEKKIILISCKNCKKVYKKDNYDSFLCNRCNHMVKKRVENSLQISLALTICAMLLYIPEWFIQ